MTWIKLVDWTLYEKDLSVILQNKSVIPDTFLYYIVQDEMPISTDDAHIIVSRQYINFTLKKDQNLWVALSDGAILAKTFIEIEHLDNFDDIEFVQRTITDTEPTVITVPRGATLTFQALSDNYPRISYGDNIFDSFLLSQYQMMSQSFPRDTTVTFLKSDSSDENYRISYSISPSAVITQLSQGLQDLINEAIAAAEWVKENAVTKDELNALIGVANHGTFSSSTIKNATNTSTLVSDLFIADVFNMGSNTIKVGDTFSVIADLSVVYTNTDTSLEVTENGRLFLSGKIAQDGRTEELYIANTSNSNLANIFENINIRVDATGYISQVYLNFKVPLKTAASSIQIAHEHSFVNLDTAGTAFSPVTSTTYTYSFLNRNLILQDNEDIVLSEILGKNNKSVFTTVNFKEINESITLTPKVLTITDAALNTVLTLTVSDTDAIISISPSIIPPNHKLEHLAIFNKEYTKVKEINFYHILDNTTSAVVKIDSSFDYLDSLFEDILACEIDITFRKES